MDMAFFHRQDQVILPAHTAGDLTGDVPVERKVMIAGHARCALIGTFTDQRTQPCGFNGQFGLVEFQQPFSRGGTANVPHAYHQNFVKHRGLPGMNVARRIRHVANATDGWQQLVDQTVPAGNRCGGDIHHIVWLETELRCHHQRRRIGMEYQNEEHLRNQKKIRWGIRCVILIPMIFLMLMFSMDSSKVVFLVLWIVSLFTISAYLIYVEYMDYTLQERLTELGIKEDGKIDTLLPNSSIDSRLAEMERKIAADRAILAKYFGESGIMPDEALLEEKEEETDEEKDSDGSSKEQISGNRDGKKREKKKDRKKDKED